MKGVLLDTHVFLWAVSAPAALSRKARTVLSNQSTEVCLSIVSFWEIAIKISLNKLVIHISFKDLLRAGIEDVHAKLLTIEMDDLEDLLELPFHHRDPFDRLLIVQARNRDLRIVSADPEFDPYETIRVW